jgi:hypothetical protein
MKKSASPALPSAAPLMIEDRRLLGTYSVMEIAMLAAACRSKDPNEKIEEAIELLNVAEEHASMGKWTKERNLRLNSGDPEGASFAKIDEEKKADEIWEQQKTTARQACADAERKLGKIVRTSLVLELCKAAGVGKATRNHSYRVFSDFVEATARQRIGEIPLNEATAFLRPGLTQAEIFANYREILVERERNFNPDNFKAQFESGSPPLIHDEHTAFWLACDFLNWLERRPPKKPPTLIRSDTNKQIVSPKNRGAKRDAKGNFAKKAD